MKKRKKPIIKVALEEINAELLEENYEIRVSYCEIQNAILEKKSGIKVVFDTVIFKNLKMNDNKLERSEFIDCIFYNCDITNNYFESSTFIRCEFHDSKLDGSHFIDSYLSDIYFKSVLGKFLDISNCKIKIFEIVDSSIEESSWFTNNMKDVSFINVSLTKSDFYQTKLDKIDLSTSNIEGMKIDLDGIKGASISKEQAILLCNLIGVNVLD